MKTKNSVLKGLTSLKSNVKIYVPSTINVDIKTDSTVYIETIQREMTILFGGTTSYETIGTWYSDELQTVVKESITIIQSFTSVLNNEDIDSLVNLCEYLKKEMLQECISLEINNKLYFI